MNARQQRGKQIVKRQDQIIRIDENHYRVNSQSRGNIQHDVVSTEFGWSCSCEDRLFRKTCCKHIHAVEISLSIRKEVEKIITVGQIQTDCCIHCKSSKIRKRGIRKNKTHSIQLYQCGDCKKYFSFNLGFEKMHASPQIIASAMQLYFTGESLRWVQKFLKL